MKYTIITKEAKSEFDESIVIKAVDENNREINGSEVRIDRRGIWSSELGKRTMGEWSINYGTMGAMTLEEAEPVIESIKTAYELLKTLK